MSRCAIPAVGSRNTSRYHPGLLSLFLSLQEAVRDSHNVSMQAPFGGPNARVSSLLRQSHRMKLRHDFPMVQRDLQFGFNKRWTVAQFGIF